MRDEHEEAAIHQERLAADLVHAPDGSCDTDKLGNIENARKDELHRMVEAHGAEKCLSIVISIKCEREQTSVRWIYSQRKGKRLECAYR